MTLLIDQTNRLLKFSSPLGENALVCTHLKGVARVSQPFEFELTFLSNFTDIMPKDIIGKPGHVAMRSGDFVTVICGDNKPIVLEVVSHKGSKLPAAKIIKSIKTRL